jgi:hypothetical protein
VHEIGAVPDHDRSVAERSQDPVERPGTRLDPFDPP